jgi:hypothetical protein
MKETYCVPRPPEIALNGNLVEPHSSAELLRLLGFCSAEASAAQDPRQVETRALLLIKTPCTSSDDDDLLCRRDNPFHTKRDEVELAVNAK